MILRGIDFGPCLDAAGLRGFMEDGYWFNRAPLIKRWYDFSGSTPVAKTVTLPSHAGNMPIADRHEGYAPQELFPQCVWWSRRQGIVLNAIGFSNPGAGQLFSAGLLKAHGKNPFMISWGSAAPERAQRMKECRGFTNILNTQLDFIPSLRKRLGLQINVSCANVHTEKLLAEEILEMLDVMNHLGIPLVVKIDVCMPLLDVLRIGKHPACDALCTSNAIPFGVRGDAINWKTLFPHGSPLAKRSERFGNGALSGEPLRKLVCEQIEAIRHVGITKPICAGGGVLRPSHVDKLVSAGLERGRDSIFIGSIAILKPWNIRSVIERAHQLLR